MPTKFRRLEPNLNAKLVFQSHNQFYGVKRVSAQIGHKGFFTGDLTFFHAELFGNDFLNTCFDIAHSSL